MYRRSVRDVLVVLLVVSFTTSMILGFTGCTGTSVSHSHESASAGNLSPSIQLDSGRSLSSSSIPLHILDAIERLSLNAQRMKEKCQDQQYKFVGNSAFSVTMKRQPANNKRLYKVINEGRIIHCQPPKAGSTSVLSALLEAQGIAFDDIHNRVDVRNVATKKLKTMANVYRARGSVAYDGMRHRFQNATWTMITRNPWTRVLSGYHDKFQRYPNNQLYDTVWGSTAAEILGLRAEDAERIPNLRMNVTFEQFTRYLSEHTGQSITKVDPHWSPFSQLCQPCLFPYKYVARIEDADELDGLLYILTGKLPEELVEEDAAAGARVHESGWSTTEAMRQYYTPQIRTWVQQVFGDDAWLMDYSFEE